MATMKAPSPELLAKLTDMVNGLPPSVRWEIFEFVVNASSDPALPDEAEDRIRDGFADQGNGQTVPLTELVPEAASIEYPVDITRTARETLDEIPTDEQPNLDWLVRILTVLGESITEVVIPFTYQYGDYLTIDRYHIVISKNHPLSSITIVAVLPSSDIDGIRSPSKQKTQEINSRPTE